MFDELLAALERRIQQPGSDAEHQAALRQNLAVRQLQSLLEPLQQQRQAAADALLHSGEARIRQGYRDARSQLTSGMAGRKLLGSSGHARERGRLLAGEQGDMADHALRAQNFLRDRKVADEQAIASQAANALSNLEAGSIGFHTSDYQNLFNRLQGEIDAAKSQAMSVSIGDFMRGPVRGAINYGFDRAHFLNGYDTNRQIRKTLGIHRAPTTNQRTFSLFE
jgi:F0F1-type ATP synthase membrane subunit b/b'